MTTPIIPAGSTVMVSGATGFIGSHVVDQLLRHGYKVRGTVRDSTKAAKLTAAFEKKYPKGAFTPVIVSHMDKPGAYDEAMQGCDAVAHVASDLTFGPDPDVVIPPVVDGVQQVLASAAATPSIKRFVLTSSSCSAVIPRPNEHYHVDASTWNDAVVPLAYDAASPADKRGFYVYSASKTLAERALWKFMDAEPRGFSANAVLPNFTTGPMIYEGQSGSTGGMTLGMYKHDDQMNAILQGFMPQWQNDVENVAMVHFAALTMGDVEKERLVVFENPFNYNDLLRVMKKINPEEKYPEPIKDLGEDISTVDNKRALELLQRLGKERFRTFEESITANCLGHY